MDHFGIGSAIASAAQMYFRCARGTRRTTSLLESVKDGDRVVFVDSHQADLFSRLCEERGVDVDCCVVDPRTPERVFEKGTPQGRTVFDHVWVEQFYTLAIERAARDIDHLETQATGYGEAHRITKRAAEELARWRI